MSTTTAVCYGATEVCHDVANLCCAVTEVCHALTDVLRTKKPFGRSKQLAVLLPYGLSNGNLSFLAMPTPPQAGPAVGCNTA